MKSKHKQLLLAGTIMLSLALTPLAGEQDVARAEGSNVSASENSADEKNQDYIYLSDLDYVGNMSSIAWGYFRMDKSPSDGQIKLKLDKDVVTFSKGIGAHATSTLVYDLSQYSDKYTKFSAYVGLDYSQGSRGNGIKFTISSSTDGKTWTTLQQTGVLKGDSSSVKVDVDISGIKYLKLYAHDNGTNGNDHAVYADAMISTEQYGNAYATIEGLSTVAEYDELLKGDSIDSNLNQNSHIIYKREFVDRVGYHALQYVYHQDPKYKAGIDALINNEKALAYYIESGVADKGASYTTSLKNWSEIYAKHKDDFNDSENGDFYLKLAVSVSMSHAKHVYFWTGTMKAHDPLVRYETYKALSTDGTMDKGGDSNIFKNLSTPMMRWVTNARLHEDEVRWLAEYALKTKDRGADYLNAYTYINYTFGYNYNNSTYYSEEDYEKWNEKYDLSAFKDYGTAGVHRNFMVFEQGGVCGSLAKTYTTLAEVFGRPAEVVAQPGHAAAIVYEERNGVGYWSLKNDVSGWAQSNTEMGDMVLNWGEESWSSHKSASYIVLTQSVLDDYENYVKALKLNVLAESYAGDVAKQQEIYKQALSIQKTNLDSMVGLINAYKADATKTSADYLALAREIVDTYTYYPLPMVDLLNLISGKVTDVNDTVVFDMLKTNALLRATKATTADTRQPDISKQMANSLLGNNKVELASFAFDGNNAKQIVINSKYDGSDIRVKYSLDGGVTWTETEDHIITLMQDQLDSITADKDIIVGLVGAQDTFTIDIKSGAQINSSSIYANDWENTLIGQTNNLEFSLDGGTTWCNFVKGTTFEGDQAVKLRYKAYGQYLQSATVDYRFTADANDDTRKYLPLKHVSLVSFSTQQNNSNQAAINFIDGNINTSWHTTWGVKDNDKSYVVKLDQERYITALEYLSNQGSNGRLKDVDIYTSMDGETWVKSGSVTNLPNNNNLQKINLDAPTKTLYVKLVGVSTYGNSSWEANMYLAGRLLNIYEDITITEAQPVVNYSTSDVTSGTVTAALDLPEGFEATGLTSYVFTKNGSYTFSYTNPAGESNSLTATVDWIVPADEVTENTIKEIVVATLNNNQVDPTSLSYVYASNTGNLEFVGSDSEMLIAQMLEEALGDVAGSYSISLLNTGVTTIDELIETGLFISYEPEVATEEEVLTNDETTTEDATTTEQEEVENPVDVSSDPTEETTTDTESTPVEETTTDAQTDATEETIPADESVVENTTTEQGEDVGITDESFSITEETTTDDETDVAEEMTADEESTSVEVPGVPDATLENELTPELESQYLGTAVVNIHEIKSTLEYVLTTENIDVAQINEILVSQPAMTGFSGNEVEALIVSQMEALLQDRVNGTFTLFISNYDTAESVKATTVEDLIQNKVIIVYQESSDTPTYGYEYGSLIRYE